MIAGLLALVLSVADTTTRIVAFDADSLRDVAVVATMPDASARTDSVVPAPTLVPSMPLARLAAAPVFVPSLLRAAEDTVPRKKRKLVEYSEWYGRRLTLHKALSWAMLPMFAVSYYTGDRLLHDGRENSPYWVRAGHPWVAAADVGIFGINTVTGLWNAWDARHDPEGRTRRIIHSLLFIAADAGFAYAGSIGAEARDNGAVRNRHRTIALGSMGVSTVGWLIMLIGN